jgi:hypothetical protein
MSQHEHDRRKPDHERKPDPKPKAKALPDAEVAALASLLVDAWQSGVPDAWADTVGGRWEYEPIRDANARLQVRRFAADPKDEAGGFVPAGEFAVSGAEFGVDKPLAIIGARILAVSSL